MQPNSITPTRSFSLLSPCATWQQTLRSAGAAALLAAIVILPLLGHKLLAEWDEAIYAGVSREMLTRSWLVPFWNGHPWLEKPPLMFWVTAIFFKLFGVSEFWARAGSALSGVAMVAILHGWLARNQDRLTAWLSTIILLATFGFQHVCRVGELDVLLSLGCIIALIGLTEVEQQRHNGWYLFWIGFAIAVMTKGAAAVVLPITAALFAITQRWRKQLFAKSAWLGLAIFLAAVLTWHIAMYHHFGQQFVNEYLGFHVLTRAMHSIEGHQSHWWYYGLVLLASAIPFVLLYPAAIRQALRQAKLQAFAIFAIVVILFFSAVQTRLPHYIAPAYPALAVLTAAYLAGRLRPFLQQPRPASFWIKLTIAAAAIYGLSAVLTAGPRSHLRTPKIVSGAPILQDKESLQLIRSVFRQPQPTTGPLLLWREAPILSVAASTFYAQRPIQQVQLEPPAPGTTTDKYSFQPETLSDAVTANPSIILLDKALIQQLPPEYLYRPIATSPTESIGLITKTQ